MIESLMKKFALSRQGALDLVKAVTATVICDLLMMMPVGLLYQLIMQMLPAAAGGTAGTDKVHGALFFAAAIVAVLVILYVMNHIKYNCQYLNTYKESGVRRITLAEKLRQLPLSFFGKKDVADLTTTIMADCTMLEQAFSHYISSYYGSLISTVVMALCLLAFNVKMSLLSLWPIVVALLIVNLTEKIQQKIGRKHIGAKLDFADGIQECLESLRDIKANNAEARCLSSLDEKIDRIEKIHIKDELTVASCVVTAQMILKFGIVSTALGGCVFLAKGEINLLMFVLYMIVVSRIYDPMSNSLQNLAAIISTKLNIARMSELENYPSQTGRIKGIENFKPANSDIVFSRVGFSYNSGETVLKDVSFTAKQGEVTALIGPSGGGKSTAARLASRFWDADTGSITLGGINVSDVDPETLLTKFSIVFQDVTLFNNTVMENIRIGRRGATDEEVRQAAREAQCDQFVLKLPHGYDTVIGENGSNLSGGERQRLSIARALLKDAPVILLDEATASLDTENETQIQKAISRLIKNKTVLIIAHRMRTVEKADKIVFLENGTVSEQGTPGELLAKNGRYATMVKLQSGK
ncbi:ABC transporter ATP-binding protein [Treponema brennaborense]|uniref:Xenobiotic-transporting ATPase n=1 Tax=Treponema brennaborense (strain DSM 12168 / CIP 105900 / DD5/3) TaxID=906968 RepID=F4LJY6_TREBD|nr:ABC transporter ATP-binding protein [Treponema brennaborense]AEE16466.1 Xenobiotic-transporting ATPase [Treponema brennaborense DSM 12168]